ncbi:MAG: anti-phage ZorAB system protein ZorA [Methylococcales bacterium]
MHEQYEYAGGQKRLARIRSTVPAESVFSPQSLIDSRLHVEFFKHLPGILTGIGIIGTFYGLIMGIQHFDPSLLAKAKTDPSQLGAMFDGLNELFKEVQGAFIASFFAIGAAMLITLLEKILLNACYRRLEKLCRKLDELYEGGVGEDYLAALVKSSAENATQTTQLKQSLVTELSELLRELTAQQIEQSKALGLSLTAKIHQQIDAGENHSERFRVVLKDGLSDIGKTVAGIAGGQGDTMTGMLEHLIQTFSANLQNAVGDQMKSLSDLMNGAVCAMTDMQTGFKTLLQDLRDSGERERKELTERVTSVVGILEAQQCKLESQTADFIEAVKNQIGASQRETIAQVKESLTDIQNSVARILSDMQKERAETAAIERERQQEFVDKSKHLMDGLEVKIGALLEGIDKSVSALNENVTALENTSITAIKGMTDGASQISTAAGRFTQAGNSVAGVIEKAGTVFTHLSDSTDGLTEASKALESQLNQFSVIRDALQKMVSQLNAMLERAKQEAGVNQQIAEDMRRMVQSFGQLKDDMDDFVEDVSKLLAETMAKFQQDIGTHNSAFHQHHADTLKQVASAYAPLAASIGGLTDIIAKTRRN